MSDAAFLATIRAKRKDRLPRLVYADWLDEHADPRGSLIRVEEEMREVPIFADRYWSLKKTRGKLRASADAAWLTAMDYGTHYEPVFREVPAGWKERFRLAREVVDRWFNVDLGDALAGRDQRQRAKMSAHISRIEDRVGRALPAALREWIAFDQDLRRLAPFLSNGIPDVEMMDGYGLVFLNLSEPPFIYFLAEDVLGQDDPPVNWVNAEDPESTGRLPSLSRFGVEYALRETGGAGAMIHWPGFAGAAQCAKVPNRLVADLETAVTVRAHLDGMTIFETRDLLAVLGQNSFYPESDANDLFIAARKPLTRAKLPPCLRQNFRPHTPTASGIFLGS